MTDLLPYSYCGLLDDKLADAYPDFSSPVFFERILAKALFFGGGLYLNDGYLFMNPAAREQLGRPNSLMSVMLSQGYVRIFTRCDSVDQLAQLPASSKVPAHVDFAESNEWSGFQAVWQRCVADAWRDGHVTPWGRPKNHRIQTHLYQRLLEKADQPADLGLECPPSVLVRMRNLLLNPADPRKHPSLGIARTRYENAVDESLNEYAIDDPNKTALRRSLMQLGNEAYHYSFGVSLSWQTGSPIAVDTTISQAFDEFIDRPRITRANWELIPSVGLRVDPNAFTDGARFRDLMDPGGDAYRAKAGFLNALVDAIGANDSGTQWAEKIKTLTNAYVVELAAILRCDADAIRDTAAGTHTIALAHGREQSGQYDAAATAIANVSVTITLPGEKGPVIGDRLATFATADPDQGFSFSGREIVPQVTNIALGPQVVDDIMSDKEITA